MKKYDKAISDYTKALQLRHDWIAFKERGIAYSEIEEYDSACEDFDRAVELYSDFEIPERELPPYEGGALLDQVKLMP